MASLHASWGSSMWSLPSRLHNDLCTEDLELVPRQNAVLNDALDMGETDCATKGVVAFDCGLDGLWPGGGNEFVQVENRLTVGGPADHELEREDVRLIPATEMPGVGDRRLGVAGDEHAGDDGDRGRFLSSGDEGIDLAL